ncbi:MAG: bifunctional oligoribonuclease/PAP phosphatase NrnA [Candidatus Omnitrophota bacterium]
MVDEVTEALKTGDNFLITAHVNPEGDSIGSQLSVYHILEKMGKNAVMVGNYIVPENLRFLPGAGSILNELPAGFRPETAIILDCPTKERIGKVNDHLEGVKLIVNIDHHISNEYFGDINWVEPEASAVGEMVYSLIEKLGMELDDKMNSAMYAAIVTDTGMFNYDNTSRRTHLVAGELIASGVNPKIMHTKLFEEKSLPQIRLMGKVLSTIKVEKDGRLAYMWMTREMQEEENIRSVATDEFINYPRSIKGVEVAVFFKERINNPGHIDISFRSMGKIDVDVIAASFGGGGHKRAAGCFLKGDLEEVREKVLKEIREVLG